IEPMIVGSYTGLKLWNKMEGLWRTRKLEEFPIEEAVEPEVISGEKMFPTSRKSHLKLFEESKYQLPDKKGGVWHAASSAKQTAFTEAIQAGKYEISYIGIGNEYLPGGFVAPSLSPYFLKVSQEPYNFIGTDLFPGTPTVAYVTPKGIEQYPGRTAKGMWNFLMGSAKKGYVYTHKASIKTEVEGLFAPRTPIAKTNVRYFIKWEGVRVPIFEYTTQISGISKGVITFGGLPTSYIPPRPPLLFTFS
ncbi:unnamed protein product, partial [marine sediment metagenome]